MNTNNDKKIIYDTHKIFINKKINNIFYYNKKYKYNKLKKIMILYLHFYIKFKLYYTHYNIYILKIYNKYDFKYIQSYYNIDIVLYFFKNAKLYYII